MIIPDAVLYRLAYGPADTSELAAALGRSHAVAYQNLYRLQRVGAVARVGGKKPVRWELGDAAPAWAHTLRGLLCERRALIEAVRG